MDRRGQTPCCQFASDDEIDSEPELYDCDHCEVATACAGLDSDNRQAWEVFHRLLTRFVVDTKLIPEVYRQLTADYAPAEAQRLLERLSVIYDLLMPDTKPTR